MRSTKKILTFSAAAFLLTTLFVSACGTTGSPSSTIEAYLNALKDKNETLAVNLSCAEWEKQALAEGESFKSVEVRLEGLSCDTTEKTGDTALVTCQGTYVFSYDGREDQEIGLQGRVFKTVSEAGEWRMCGYQE
ncbi:MAG: hypothetical protein R6U51_05410 [Anaerolineales bacterium]